MSINQVMVVGGANMDIAGRPASTLVARDSNIGAVRLSHGGVGRNIAHNLALLGTSVGLVTAFGDDAQGSSLKDGCQAAGIDISSALTIPGAASSTYLFVMDDTGDMQVAINDMAILEELTRERLANRLPLLREARVVVVDSNLPEKTIAWLCSELADVPIFCDPISVAKAPKLVGSLEHIHTIKPNRLEAEALTGIRVHDGTSLTVAAGTLLESGVGRAFVSLGADGIYCEDATQSRKLSTLPGRLVNATGAGDAMMSALIWAYLHDLDLVESAYAGLAASAIAMESEETVSPLMSENALLERMREASPSI